MLPLLKSNGLLPPGEYSDTDVKPDAAGDLLPSLLALWSEWRRVAPKAPRNRAARVESWLKARLEQRAALTVEIPAVNSQLSERWAGQRLYWWPRGVVSGVRLGMAASRVGRNPDDLAAVLRALRYALGSSWTDGIEALVNVQGTSLSEYVTRAGVLFGVPVLEVVVSESRSQKWLDVLMTQCKPDGRSLLISPEQNSAVRSELLALKTIPARDRFQTLLSDRLCVLRLRESGNYQRLLAARLAEPNWLPASVRLVSGERLCGDAMIENLRGRGAVPWLLTDDRESFRPNAQGDTEPASDAETRRQLVPQPSPGPAAQELSGNTFPVFGGARPERVSEAERVVRSAARRLKSCVGMNPEQTSALRNQLLGELRNTPESDTGEPLWLTHWTRETRAEWPDETLDERLDAQLLGLSSADHSALATLRHIVSGGSLLATQAGIPDGRRAVCFSAVPLRELSNRRVYRTHRGRWDFELFGICLRLCRARQLGIRPVIYGDESERASIPEAERIWFQRAESRLSGSERTIDWRAEQEWRSASDVPFEAFDPDDLFVFCPARELADALQQISRWPVIALSDLFELETLTSCPGITSRSPGGLIVIGASARAAAQCARRSGFDVWSVDQFGDVDLLDISAASKTVTDWPTGIPAAVQQLPVAPVIYCGALENSPEILLKLADRRTVLGNSPAVLADVRDPVRVQQQLRQAGLPALKIAQTVDEASPELDWLLKPLRGAAGIGISRFDRALDGSLSGDRFLQQFVAGQTISGLFLASASEVCLLGLTEQLCGVPEVGADGFLYAGSIAPLSEHDLPRQCVEQAVAAGRILGRSLCGLFGIDFVWDKSATVLWTLEVNPRFPASAELLERALGWPLIRWHVACFLDGELPATARNAVDSLNAPRDTVFGKLIVYAPQTVQIGSLKSLAANLAGGDCEVADIPTDGSVIPAGTPVCTLLLQSPSVTECRSGLLSCGAGLRAKLRSLTACE